jgi:hypothetical protein
MGIDIDELAVTHVGASLGTDVSVFGGTNVAIAVNMTDGSISSSGLPIGIRWRSMCCGTATRKMNVVATSSPSHSRSHSHRSSANGMGIPQQLQLCDLLVVIWLSASTSGAPTYVQLVRPWGYAI